MNIGLVLSGGFAKGAYQIGALQAVSEFIPQDKIKYYSCASIGALNGYAYATGALDTARQLWSNMCSGESRIMITKMLKGELMSQNIAQICATDSPLPPAFYCSLFDLTHRNIVYKNLSGVDTQLIPSYLQAGIAMPVYNRPVTISGTAYYDGGMVDNIPVFPLMKHNLDYLICIYMDDVSYKFENLYFDNKIIKITFPNQIAHSLTVRQDSIDQMMHAGYEHTMQLLEIIFSHGYEDIDHIYRTIEFLNRGKGKEFRITGDMLMTNLNKVTQKLTKRKII